MTILLEDTDQLRWQTDWRMLLQPWLPQVAALNRLATALERHFIDNHSPEKLHKYTAKNVYK